MLKEEGHTLTTLNIAQRKYVPDYHIGADVDELKGAVASALQLSGLINGKVDGFKIKKKKRNLFLLHPEPLLQVPCAHQARCRYAQCYCYQSYYHNVDYEPVALNLCRGTL